MDKRLFTPGPLTTSDTVKRAMLRDLGSRDREFIALVGRVRASLLAAVGLGPGDGHTAVIVQGSGTFGLEAALSSVIPPDGKLLVATNGAYGERLERIAAIHGIATRVARSPEDAPLDLSAVDGALAGDPAISHVAWVHCETSTGMVNPIGELAEIVRGHGRKTIVDSMSGFAALPLDLSSRPVDYLVSSANKGLEGVPGFAFVICRTPELERTKGYARTLSLDLHDQWRGLEKDGQFRFTPPTHVVLAAEQALRELDREGGVPGRGKRYRENHAVLVSGMREMGFRTYLPDRLQSPVITSFVIPRENGFSFDRLYDGLSERGFLIYPGKVTDAATFRIGTIGRLLPDDIRALLGAIRETLVRMELQLPLGA